MHRTYIDTRVETNVYRCGPQHTLVKPFSITQNDNAQIIKAKIMGLLSVLIAYDIDTIYNSCRPSTLTPSFSFLIRGSSSLIHLRSNLRTRSSSRSSIKLSSTSDMIPNTKHAIFVDKLVYMLNRHIFLTLATR